MSVFLLFLGALTTASGFALLASGMTMQGGAFNLDALTPGTIAAVGGLLLIGMGLAVRQLRRIEKALAARPVPRSIQPAEESGTAAGPPLDAAPRIPLPTQPSADAKLEAASAGSSTAAAATNDAALEQLQAKVPAVHQPERSPVLDGNDVSLKPRTPNGGDSEVKKAGEAAAVTRPGNARAPSGTALPREAKVHLSAAPNSKSAALNVFWPIAPRRSTQAATAEVAAPVPAPPVATEANESKPARTAEGAAAAEAARMPVSVLKTGVVEGMAYTLYSDGSIEAQLPQGTLRFGSIAALRNHIESRR